MKRGTTSKKAGKAAKTATTEPITEATPTEPTSLPPSVRGPLSGHVKVTIGKVVLIRQRRVFGTRPSNPAKQTPPKVRVEWWGAQSAALFFPKQVASRSANVSFAVDKARPTTLRFPVLCPKQNLLAYLRDMGPLHLVVLGPDGQVGRATVPDLTAIAGEPYSKPVSGWFQIVSPDPVGTGAGLTILGELHFSVMWESLSSASPISSRSPSRASASSPISRIRPPSRTFNTDYDKGSAMSVGIDDDYPNDDQENEDDLSVLIETGAANNIASDYRNTTSVSKTSSTNVLSKQNSKTVVFDLKERINSTEYNIEDEDYTDMNEESNAESDMAANVSSYYEEPTSVSTSYYNES
ncbi:C2 domain-containing protein 3, partial [Rhizoclosmatium hyalinum]